MTDMDVINVNFSSSTTPELLMKNFDHYCEYRRTPNGIVLAPIQINRWLVVFCDEINLPQPDKYGTQRVISFMRQLVEQVNQPLEYIIQIYCLFRMDFTVIAIGCPWNEYSSSVRAIHPQIQAVIHCPRGFCATCPSSMWIIRAGHHSTKFMALFRAQYFAKQHNYERWPNRSPKRWWSFTCKVR